MVKLFQRHRVKQDQAMDNISLFNMVKEMFNHALATKVVKIDENIAMI